MSIKIDGVNNRISKIKNDYTNSVKVNDSLYVGEKFVDPNGQSGINPVDISYNGYYKKGIDYNESTPSITVNVMNNYGYTYGSKENGVVYKEITTNKTLYQSDLEGYGGIYVNIPEPEDSEDPIEPENPEDIVVTFGGAIKDTTNNKTIESTSYDGSINWDNQVKLGVTAFKIPWSCNTGNQGEGSGEVELIFKEDNWEINKDTGSPSSLEYTTTIEAGYYYVTIRGTLFLNTENKKLELWVSYSSQLIPEQPEVGLAFSYGVTSGTQATISQIVVEQASTLSLCQNVVEENSSVSRYENLIVNNDALIQGNLNVYGYINDLSWYWDEFNLNNASIELGTGFLAKMIDCSLQIGDAAIQIPTLQLSPGSFYKTDAYTIYWTADGNLTIHSQGVLTNLNGLIKVLRYQ